MGARAFWSGVWAELTGVGEQRRTIAALRVQHFNEAADFLDHLTAPAGVPVTPARPAERRNT